MPLVSTSAYSFMTHVDVIPEFPGAFSDGLVSLWPCQSIHHQFSLQSGCSPLCDSATCASAVAFLIFFPHSYTNVRSLASFLAMLNQYL